jgi:hypothetical protein
MSGHSLPSKSTFLAQNVVPANDNDAFNDNTCVLCWDSYDDAEHSGVRILPCNHVFGLAYLPVMIQAPNGDYCPICRTQLFRPSHLVAFQRICTLATDRLEHSVFAILNMLRMALYHLSEAADAMPQYLQPWIDGARQLTLFWLNADNLYWYAELLIDKHTDLRARNPDLNIKLAKQRYRLLLTAAAQIRDWLSIQNTAIN